MNKAKFLLLSFAMAISGLASAQKMSLQDIADHEASEYINRTNSSLKEIEEQLLSYPDFKLSKKSIDLAIAKAEKEWGGPEIWNQKAEFVAKTALEENKLSCPELLSELVQRRKFTVPQANYAAKKLKVCQ
ncbi:hypothetical protein [Comamonas jiangduensis]|uniref:hypothetical protein n=1 Tax=Comamonas jiangduensis TaxID=1194168 RepID=UPI0028A6EC41|nr:hypothetical protein [Comamonas jiangduensis]